MFVTYILTPPTILFTFRKEMSVIDTLLQTGDVDMNRQNKKGLTALHIAIGIFDFITYYYRYENLHYILL